MTTSEGAISTLSFAALGAGVYAKTAFEPERNKWKWIKFRAESPAPFRLFKKDCEFYVKPWGSAGGYQVVRPFGDYHRADGARI